MGRLRWLAAVVFAFVAAPAEAQTVKQRTFESPEAAADALRAAYANGGQAAINAVTGDKGMRIAKSGDPVIDRHEREWFLRIFEQGHEIDRESDTRAALLLGEDQLPYPIPVIARGGRWRFDPSEGHEDLLSRRIAKTELTVLDFLLQIAKGQREHFAVAREPGGVHEYARRFVGDPKRRDGMVYVGADGKLAGPMAAFGTAAVSAGYRPDERLFHGYRFHTLEAQGANAPGGARSYMTDGRLTKGFAVVACPLRYAVSGVLSYMVNQDGVVYHRDMGKQTAKACPAIRSFDPDPRWSKGVSG